MNNLQRVLISILATSEVPLSGYDIAKLITDKTGNSHQQIYRELRAMHKEGMLVCMMVPQDDKPDKKIYSLTGDGFNKFLETAGEPHMIESSFSKTAASYEILIFDIENGTNNHAEYISTMQNAEMEFYNRLMSNE